MAKSKRCKGKKADGTPCRSWAVKASTPPRCAAHGGTHRRIGAPPGNKNARKHGVYSGGAPADLDARIADLDRRVQELDQYIDANKPELDTTEVVRLYALHGQLISRLGRLLRDRKHVTGDIDDELQQAMDEALDIAWERWRQWADEDE